VSLEMCLIKSDIVNVQSQLTVLIIFTYLCQSTEKLINTHTIHINSICRVLLKPNNVEELTSKLLASLLVSVSANQCRLD